MAATRLIPLHMNKGRSIAKSLADRTDYAEDGEKTDDGRYISSYECDPKTVDEEFMLTKQKYAQTVGRDSSRNVIAYQLRQSFKPGEVLPAEANVIGYELAMRFTKGRHAFIVATHTDKAHIHNHIIFNSTATDGQHKFRNFFMSSYAIRGISDRLCIEHGLSVITPLPFVQRKKRTTYPKRKTIREGIRKAIDVEMLRKPADFEELLRFLKADGYEIKRGRNVSFKGKKQKTFIRLRSLGKGYSEEDIEGRIHGRSFSDENQEKADERNNRNTADPEDGLNYLIDIDKKIREGKGQGYVTWAQKFNLKQISQMMRFMQENKIAGPDDLRIRTAEATERFSVLSSSIKGYESRLAEISELRKHIINYSKTKKVYADYRKAGYSKRFLEAHREEILLHKAAKQAFDRLGTKKIPRVKELSEEYTRILATKNKLYAEYRHAKEEMKQYQTAQQISKSIMEEDGLRENDRETRGSERRDRHV